ncbi:hypothetical protein BJ508DRAFT_87997 [Ascobolus immersus RN42]|uniref:Uncharacterized protein n=1 Tax=Ascobolus immersus RN42 TaxID=1160509 RepID=A0A3N4HEP9_ASCIM|nr:hypothetical protein BJ508DRAFT_87997 [Ascobolus immersus RN42]
MECSAPSDIDGAHTAHFLYSFQPFNVYGLATDTEEASDQPRNSALNYVLGPGPSDNVNVALDTIYRRHGKKVFDSGEPEDEPDADMANWQKEPVAPTCTMDTDEMTSYWNPLHHLNISALSSASPSHTSQSYIHTAVLDADSESDTARAWIQSLQKSDRINLVLHTDCDYPRSCSRSNVRNLEDTGFSIKAVLVLVEFEVTVFGDDG